jgi:hypothetical protein
MSGALDVAIPILLGMAVFMILMRIGIYCLLVSDKLVIFFFGIPIMLPYETITSIRPRGLLELFGADILLTPTWVLTSRLWGSKLWIETNQGFVRRFVVSPRSTEKFEQELRSRVDERVRALEAAQSVASAQQARPTVSAK